MTDHIKVKESYVEALINNAAWDSARISLVEKKEKKDDKEKDSGAKKDTGASKGDKPKGKAEKDKDKPDFTTGARAGDEDEEGTGKDYEKAKVACESVEEHVCPLCESILEEDITDEQLAEHIALIEDAMGKLDEEDENIDEEDSVEEDTAFKKVMTKVAALKTANQAAK